MDLHIKPPVRTTRVTRERMVMMMVVMMPWVSSPPGSVTFRWRDALAREKKKVYPEVGRGIDY